MPLADMPAFLAPYPLSSLIKLVYPFGSSPLSLGKYAGRT